MNCFFPPAWRPFKESCAINHSLGYAPKDPELCFSEYHIAVVVEYFSDTGKEKGVQSFHLFHL